MTTVGQRLGKMVITGDVKFATGSYGYMSATEIVVRGTMMEGIMAVDNISIIHIAWRVIRAFLMLPVLWLCVIVSIVDEPVGQYLFRACRVGPEDWWSDD